MTDSLDDDNWESFSSSSSSQVKASPSPSPSPSVPFSRGGQTSDKDRQSDPKNPKKDVRRESQDARAKDKKDDGFSKSPPTDVRDGWKGSRGSRGSSSRAGGSSMPGRMMSHHSRDSYPSSSSHSMYSMHAGHGLPPTGPKSVPSPQAPTPNIYAAKKRAYQEFERVMGSKPSQKMHEALDSAISVFYTQMAGHITGMSSTSISTSAPSKKKKTAAGKSTDEVSFASLMPGNVILDVASSTPSPSSSSSSSSTDSTMASTTSNPEIVEQLRKRTRGLLNKLSIENRETIFAQLMDLSLPDVSSLRSVVSEVFQKAVLEPNFNSLYGDLCLKWAEVAPVFPAPDPSDSSLTIEVTFTSILLSLVTEEFARGSRPPSTPPDPSLSKEEIYERNYLRRLQMKGNLQFIGTLYKVRMLPQPIVQEVLASLSNPEVSHSEEDWEAFVSLMLSVGRLIEVESKRSMDELIDRLQKCLEAFGDTLSTRIRFQLEDVLDTRNWDWVPWKDRKGKRKYSLLSDSTSPTGSTPLSAAAAAAKDPASSIGGPSSSLPSSKRHPHSKKEKSKSKSKSKSNPPLPSSTTSTTTDTVTTTTTSGILPTPAEQNTTPSTPPQTQTQTQPHSHSSTKRKNSPVSAESLLPRLCSNDLILSPPGGSSPSKFSQKKFSRLSESDKSYFISLSRSLSREGFASSIFDSLMRIQSNWNSPTQVYAPQLSVAMIKVKAMFRLNLLTASSLFVEFSECLATPSLPPSLPPTAGIVISKAIDARVIEMNWVTGWAKKSYKSGGSGMKGVVVAMLGSAFRAHFSSTEGVGGMKRVKKRNYREFRSSPFIPLPIILGKPLYDPLVVDVLVSERIENYFPTFDLGRRVRELFDSNSSSAVSSSSLESSLADIVSEIEEMKGIKGGWKDATLVIVNELIASSGSDPNPREKVGILCANFTHFLNGLMTPSPKSPPPKPPSPLTPLNSSSNNEQSPRTGSSEGQLLFLQSIEEIITSTPRFANSGIMNALFEALYEYELCDFDSFSEWKESGKKNRGGLFLVSHFFYKLQQSLHDDDDDDDDEDEDDDEDDDEGNGSFSQEGEEGNENDDQEGEGEGEGDD